MHTGLVICTILDILYHIWPLTLGTCTLQSWKTVCLIKNSLYAHGWHTQVCEWSRYDGYLCYICIPHVCIPNYMQPWHILPQLTIGINHSQHLICAFYILIAVVLKGMETKTSAGTKTLAQPQVQAVWIAPIIAQCDQRDNVLAIDKG